MILACSVVLWVLLNFPRGSSRRRSASRGLRAPRAERAQPRATLLGRATAAGWATRIEPAIAPLGFDWKIGVGIIGAFAAREVFVATMGVVYGAGDDVDEESATLRDKLRAETQRRRPPGLHAAGRAVADGLLRARLPVHEHAGGGQARDAGLRLAAVPVRLHDGLAWVVSFVVYQGGRLLGFG